MPRISAVVFDMYGTLTPSWSAAVWTEQKQVCAAPLGVPGPAWIDELDAAWHERMVGEFGGLSETFRVIAGRMGHAPTEAQLAEAVAQRHASYLQVHELRPESLPTLRRLRADDFKIALVSDCTQELPDLWKTLSLAPHFDATVFSCCEGVRKPDSKLFLAAAQRLGVPTQECLYVGDGGGDEMAGSAAVGMTPVLIAGPDWAEHHAPGRPEAQWDGLRIESLSQIPDIVAGLSHG